MDKFLNEFDSFLQFHCLISTFIKRNIVEAVPHFASLVASMTTWSSDVLNVCPEYMWAQQETVPKNFARP